jgi:hypothetical protein
MQPVCSQSQRSTPHRLETAAEFLGSPSNHCTAPIISFSAHLRVETLAQQLVHEVFEQAAAVDARLGGA